MLGNPNDGVRDLPDVSLFAANGVWSHYYIVCTKIISGSMVNGSTISATTTTLEAPTTVQEATLLTAGSVLGVNSELAAGTIIF